MIHNQDPNEEVVTLFVRDLPKDYDDRELQADLHDLPHGKKEAAEQALKVEFAEKQVQEMERLAEAARKAQVEAQERVAKAHDTLLNARQAHAAVRLKGRKVTKSMIMRKGDHCSAFVRFETLADTKRALEEIKDGSVQICGRTIGAEMARKNTV